MLLGSREQRFNGFVAQDEQCCHGSGPLWNGFVCCGFADAQMICLSRSFCKSSKKVLGPDCCGHHQIGRAIARVVERVYGGQGGMRSARGDR
jgi:hypothetical protein